MTCRTHTTIVIFLATAFLLGPLAPPARAQQRADERYRSPRATVRTLLTAITLARSNPEHIRDAVACLDLTGLPANQKDGAALRATELEAVLRSNDIDTCFLPDAPTENTYVLPHDHGQRLALERGADGRWRFDRETVAQIPRLYAESQKQLQARNREAAQLKVTHDYASARATLRTLIEAYRRQDMPRILRGLDLSDVPHVAREEVGTQLANKLR